MRRRDAVGVTVGPMDLNGLNSVGPDELGEASQRHSGAGRSELEKLGSLGLRERSERSP